jgi:type I restriction enzyme R subunit
MSAFGESVVEQAALAWLESAGWQVRNGGEIAPCEPAARRDDYGQVNPAQRLRESLIPLYSGELRMKDAEKFVASAVR